MDTGPELEPREPDTAVEQHLKDREQELAATTHRSHTERLGHFVRWCGKNGTTNLNDVSGRDVNHHRIWRSEGIKRVTFKTRLDTLRVFLRWAASIDAVHPDLPDKAQSPTLPKNANPTVTTSSASSVTILERRNSPDKYLLSPDHERTTRRHASGTPLVRGTQSVYLSERAAT